MNAVHSEYTDYVKTSQISTTLNSKNLSIGDVISCTYTANEGGLAVLTMDNGKSFKAPAENIVGEIGSKPDFDVVDTKGNSVVMKQIIEDEAESAAKADDALLSGDELLNWTKGSVIPVTGAAFRSSKIRFEEIAVENAEMLNAVERIKKDIMFAVKNLNGSSLALLAENGISPGAITMTMLSNAIKTAVKGVADEPTAEQITNALKEFANSADKSAYEQSLNSVKALLSEDAAVTESNVAKLNNLQQMFEEISEMDINNKIDFLKTDGAFTINGLYASMHGGGKNLEPNVADNAKWNEIESAVIKFMERENIKPTEENLRAAKLLIQNETPVSKTNIDFINGNLEMNNINDILQKAAENIQNGKPAFDALVISDSAVLSPRQIFENGKNIINELKNVTDDAVYAVVESEKAVTVKELINKQRELNDNNENQRQEGNRRHNDRFLSEKIKLEELRLRLTLEAAAQMAKAGISIDGVELQDAINALKEMETRGNMAALAVAGAHSTRENAQAISHISGVFKSLSHTSDSVLRGILNKEINFTAEEIHAANVIKRETEATLGYEANETRVNAKFGDGFGKVAGQIETLLASLGIEPDAPNVKAAGSLIKTGTDVTKENIEAIKAINNKIQNVSQNLHPIIAAEMIKDGFNPLTSHIDEVIAYINKFNEINGEPPVESIEKAIFDMDEKGELTKEDRESLVAMYRMLTAINKHETAASAVISKSGKSLTLENLLESGKYFAKSKGRKNVIEKTIDDNFGFAERPDNRNSIREMINKAFRDSVEELNAQGVQFERAVQIAEDNNLGQTAQNMEAVKIVNDFEMAETKLNEILNLRGQIDKLAESLKERKALTYFKSLSAEDLQKTEIAKLIEGMKEFIENASNADAQRNMSESTAFNVFKQDIISLRGISPQQIAWLASLNLPVTISNVKTAKNMASDDSYLGKKLNALNEAAKEVTKTGIDDGDTIGGIKHANSAENAAERSERINEKISEIIDKAIVLDAPKKMELLRHAIETRNALLAAEKARDSIGHYQFPVKLNGKIGNLNVYLLNDNFSVNNVNAFVRLNFEALGTVEGSISIQNGVADIQISAENEIGLTLLEEHSPVLKQMLELPGFNNCNITFLKNAGKHLQDEKITANENNPGEKEAKSESRLMDIKL